MEAVTSPRSQQKVAGTKTSCSGLRTAAPFALWASGLSIHSRTAPVCGAPGHLQGPNDYTGLRVISPWELEYLTSIQH